MKKWFLVVEKDLKGDPNAYLLTDVAYLDTEDYNMYALKIDGTYVDHRDVLAGVWFGLETGVTKVDVDEKTAKQYEKMLLDNKMKALPWQW